MGCGCRDEVGVVSLRTVVRTGMVFDCGGAIGRVGAGIPLYKVVCIVRGFGFRGQVGIFISSRVLVVLAGFVSDFGGVTQDVCRCLSSWEVSILRGFNCWEGVDILTVSSRADVLPGVVFDCGGAIEQVDTGTSLCEVFILGGLD